MMKWIVSLAFLNKASVTRLNGGTGSLVLVGIQENMIHFAHQHAKDGRKLMDPLYILDARCVGRLLFSEFVPFPNGQEFIGLAKEKNFTVSWINRLRGKDQDALFLMDAS
jgi:hypothetical protein